MAPGLKADGHLESQRCMGPMGTYVKRLNSPVIILEWTKGWVNMIINEVLVISF